ncbi:MAG: hypothetical protein ACLP7Q_11210 [Isosphaeraceae bacterium]
MIEAHQSGARSSHGFASGATAFHRLRGGLGWLLVLLLPPVMVLAGYHRPMFQRAKEWAISGDAATYAYQFARIGELRGQWWKLGQDDLVGAPYQPIFGKHPGVFEGVDLLLVSTFSSRWLDPVTNYHVMMMLVLAASGWVVGVIVRRLTGSWFWAAVAIILVSWNYSTAFRLQGHAHLFKYGWTLLAVTAFSRYLDRPTPRRGLLLGLAMALVLQGSFYLGAFLGLSCGVWWLGTLVAGRLSLRHVQSAALALGAFLAAATVLTFPVWTISSSRLLADSYQSHGRLEAWNNSAELWQYFLSPASPFATSYVKEFSDRYHLEKGVFEGWHYPGLTVLLAISAYLIARLRGTHLRVSDPRLLDRFMGLSALFVLLSLAGGPSFFMVTGLGCFRAYGRAGLLALPLWCVAAPLVLQAMVRAPRLARVRPALCLAILGIALYEGHGATAWFPTCQPIETPRWVEWLARQPAGVRLAAFSPAREPEADGWGYDSLSYRLEHRHPTLNGADWLLLESDLKLLGASYERINPPALRFIASLGYPTLAFHHDYLAKNPWITSLPWLDTIENVGPWRICRTSAKFQPLPRVPLDRVVGAWPRAQQILDVPADCWITDQFHLPCVQIVAKARPVWVGWTDSRGRTVGKWTRALFQHVFGPQIPAFAVKTPRQAGDYRLVFRDDQGRPVQTRPYRVRADLATILTESGNTPVSTSAAMTQDASALVSIAAEMDDDPPAVILENKTQLYLQANTSREQVYLKSAQVHPAAMRTSAGSLVLEALWSSADHPFESFEQAIRLPRDLPPGARLRMVLEPARFGSEAIAGLRLRPSFLGRGEFTGTPWQPVVRLVRSQVSDRR